MNLASLPHAYRARLACGHTFPPQFSLWILNYNCHLYLWTLTLSSTMNGKITYRIHLKIDQLSSCQGDHHLSLVHSTFHNRFLPRGLPLIDSLVCPYVPNAIRIHLESATRRKSTLAMWSFPQHDPHPYQMGHSYFKWHHYIKALVGSMTKNY